MIRFPRSVRVVFALVFLALCVAPASGPVRAQNAEPASGPGKAGASFLGATLMLDTEAGCCEAFMPMEAWLDAVTAHEDILDASVDRSDPMEVLVTVRWKEGRKLGFRIQQAGMRLFLLRYVEDGRVITPDGPGARLEMVARFRALAAP